MSIEYTKTIMRVCGKPMKVNTGAYVYGHHTDAYYGQSETFQERLVYWMDMNGITQAELKRRLDQYARSCNIDPYKLDLTFSQPTISGYCRGRFCPKEKRKEFLAAAIGVTEKWLEGNMPREQLLPWSYAPILNLHAPRTTYHTLDPIVA